MDNHRYEKKGKGYKVKERQAMLRRERLTTANAMRQIG